MFGDASGAFVGDFNRLWREVKLIANGVQPEYVKRGGYLTAGCKAKLKELDLHWHDLRHECASRWLEDGLDVREIQVLLGHAKLEITQRYFEHHGRGSRAIDARALGPAACGKTRSRLRVAVDSKVLSDGER